IHQILHSISFLLSKEGSLMFQQMPMVEIDGMKLVQTRAILNYIATKYDLYGKDMKERALIHVYSEGVTDLGEMIMLLTVNPPDQKDVKMTLIRERTTNRYLPAFEKVSGLFSIFGTEIRGPRKIVPGIAGALTFTSVILPKL
uniref:glutathione transferase n=1 Tax=Balaenoptera musculus TaxID=9771 RepID=A0A8C0DHV2_BALMU